MKKIICIVSVGIVSVLLPVAAVHACCGMIPTITDDPIITCCPGNEITISGTITGNDIMASMGDPDTYSTDATVEVVITTPGGTVESPIVATLGPWTETPPTATTTFSAPYTPSEVGTYTYVKTVTWTTPFPWSETTSASGEFVVEQCEPSIDIKGGSCPNPFNPKSKGSVPVAILGVDVDAIDPASLTLWVTSKNGEPFGPTEVAGPLEGVGEIEDSTQPGEYDPADCYDCFDADDPANYNLDLDGDGTPDVYDGDGCPELVVKFDNQAITAAIAAAGGAAKGDCIDFEMLNAAGEVLGRDSMLMLKAIAAD